MLFFMLTFFGFDIIRFITIHHFKPFRETPSMTKPFIKPPKKRSTSVCFRDDQFRLLQKIKKRDKIPVARIIEQVIDKYFEKDLKLKK